VAAAQTTEQDPPLDDEARQLKLAEAKAASRKAIAEAEKATLAAQLPTSDLKPIEGKVELGDKVGLIGELLAYGRLLPAAKKIAARFGKGQRVLIVEDRDLIESDWVCEVVRRQLVHQGAVLDRARLGVTDALAAGLAEPPIEDSATPEAEIQESVIAAGAALTTATSLVGAAATLAGMFRSDYSIKRRDVAVTTTPLVAAAADALREQDVLVNVDGFALLAGSSTVGAFYDLWTARSELNDLELQLTKMYAAAEEDAKDLREEARKLADAYDGELAKPSSPPTADQLEQRLSTVRQALATTEAALSRPRAAIAFATATGAAFDAFATAVSAPAKEGARPPLVLAAMREPLHRDENRVTHVLYVAVEAPGAETITKHGFFGSSGRVKFLGGMQVSYLVLDVANACISAAGTEPLLAHMDYDFGSGWAGRVEPIAIRSD
jgi:hypothetical protein